MAGKASVTPSVPVGIALAGCVLGILLAVFLIHGSSRPTGFRNPSPSASPSTAPAAMVATTPAVVPTPTPSVLAWPPAPSPSVSPSPRLSSTPGPAAARPLPKATVAPAPASGLLPTPPAPAAAVAPPLPAALPPVHTAATLRPSPAHTPTPTPTPTAPPLADAPRVVAQAPVADFQDRALPPPEDDFRAIVLGVTRVEPAAATCKVWAFLYNATGRGQQVAVRPHLRDAAGEELDVVGYHPAGQAVAVASGHVLYLWPTFRGGSAADGLELSLDLQGYGRLHVPARERMTNLGPWDDLPPGVRDPLGLDFRSFGRFQWWER